MKADPKLGNDDYKQTRRAWADHQYAVPRAEGMFTIGPQIGVSGKKAEHQVRTEQPDVPVQNTSSREVIIGPDVQTGNRVEAGEPKRCSALTERKTLSPALINAALGTMNITYERDREGDYHLHVPNDICNGWAYATCILGDTDYLCL